jgi:two-component system OmpR family response regulator
LLGAVETQLRKQTWRTEQIPHPDSGTLYSFTGWTFETDRRRLLSPGGAESLLTTSEAQLLITLLENANSVLSRDFLFESMRRSASSPFDRTIDVLISRLRRKIEDNPRNPLMLTTVRNVGYLLNAEVEKTTKDAAA